VQGRGPLQPLLGRRSGWVWDDRRPGWLGGTGCPPLADQPVAPGVGLGEGRGWVPAFDAPKADGGGGGACGSSVQGFGRIGGGCALASFAL